MDAAASLLRAYPGLLVQVGCDVRVGARGVAGGPWQVRIDEPRSPRQELAVLHVRDGAVITVSLGAADTAAAGRTSVVSATIVAGTAAGAVAFARAVAGADAARAMPLLDSRGIAALLLLADGQTAATQAPRPHLAKD